MKDNSAWIEAATALIQNPHEMVRCPSCGLAYLQVDDEKIDDEHFDRHLRCSNCGTHEIIFKRAEKSQ
ncbi:MAG: hypothetical protein WCO56_27755 [Verrucomicrobiota bacterium]